MVCARQGDRHSPSLSDFILKCYRLSRWEKWESTNEHAKMRSQSLIARIGGSRTVCQREIGASGDHLVGLRVLSLFHFPGKSCIGLVVCVSPTLRVTTPLSLLIGLFAIMLLRKCRVERKRSSIRERQQLIYCQKTGDLKKGTPG
jgi:hypothetical protein